MLIRRKMLQEIVLLLACTALAQGGVRRNQRIFGGTKATLGEFPWQVSLQYKATNVSFCGGAILDERTIVTAASCGSPNEAGDLHVASGTLSVSPVGMRNATITSIAEIIHHDDYISQYEHDNIAIWKLNRPLELDGVYAAAIQLLLQDTPVVVGALTQVSGWGFMEWHGTTTSPDLLGVDLNIKDYDWCQQMHSGDMGPNEICAVFVNGGMRDVCEGDTGGALSMNGTLVGIVHWGNRCGQVALPGVYTVAAKYTDWITRVSGVAPPA